MTEEERAARHRAQRSARCQAECERIKALSGDPDARAALSSAWEPLYFAELEKDDVDDCCAPCVDYPTGHLIVNG